MIKEDLEAADKIINLLRTSIDKGIITRQHVLQSISPNKGRAVPDLPEFTFPGSGITVKIRRLGPFTLDAISQNARFNEPPPEIPKVMVNYGTAEAPRYEMEENPADPSYRDAIAEYERKIEQSGGREIIDKIIKHAVVADVDHDEVSSMKDLLLEMGMTQEELDSTSEHMIFVKHICIKTTDDLTQLQRFVLGESMPTEERIKAHEDSFPDKVQEKASGSVQSVPVRNEA